MIGYIFYKLIFGLGNICIYDYDNGIKCKVNMCLYIIILYFFYIIEILKVIFYDKIYINCKYYVFYFCENWSGCFFDGCYGRFMIFYGILF